MHLLSNYYILFLAAFAFLMICEVVYFKIADAYNIIDKPNQRSSHTLPTIRGGGIIFIIAILGWAVFGNFVFPWMILGAILIALVSFIDDIKEQPPLLRFALQLIALLFLFWQVNFFIHPAWLIVVAAIVVVGTVNAFNFMDGINGITGIYAAVNLLTFLYINEYVISFTEKPLLVVVLAGVFVFLFFNFRKKARCFAGDVGSVTLAYFQIFSLLQLIQKTNQFAWILLFLVFGVDSVITILFRLSRKENIFKPHRTHLYQYLANELGFSHRMVSALYGIIQGGINGVLIYLLTRSESIIVVALMGLLYSIVYLLVRVRIHHIIARVNS